jgi:hypothetical protein
MLKSAYGEECLPRTSVSEWHEGSKLGDERKHRPSSSRTEESTEVIQKCLAQEVTLIVRMLDELTGINREAVLEALVEDLRKKKLMLVVLLVC